MDQPLLIDERSLRDVDIDLKSNASLEASGLSARTALRQLLASKGLTYIIQNETIQVVTVERARESLTTRVYYVGDLIMGLSIPETLLNAAVLMEAIQDTVDPLSWKKRGGPSTITFFAPNLSFIVRASTEVHASLGSKFSK